MKTMLQSFFMTVFLLLQACAGVSDLKCGSPLDVWDKSYDVHLKQKSYGMKYVFPDKDIDCTDTVELVYNLKHFREWHTNTNCERFIVLHFDAKRDRPAETYIGYRCEGEPEADKGGWCWCDAPQQFTRWIPVEVLINPFTNKIEYK